MTNEISEKKKTYRPEKQAILGEVRDRVAGSSFFLITDYRGMKVISSWVCARSCARPGPRSMW